MMIITWFAVRIQHDNTNTATSYEIARGLEVSPSSHLRAILAEMVAEGQLVAMKVEKQGRWAGQGYMLPANSYQLPLKKTRTIKITHNGIAQLEMFTS